jgi:hypothetical protein
MPTIHSSAYVIQRCTLGRVFYSADTKEPCDTRAQGDQQYTLSALDIVLHRNMLQNTATHCNTLQHTSHREIPEMYSKRPWRPICVGIERVREKQKSVRVGFNGLSAEDVLPNASCPCVT